MSSDAWIILLVSGLFSFLIGAWLRRLMNRRRFERSQQAMAQMRAAIAERDRNAPASHNKAKRRRQQRARRSGDQES